jgi:hypothetical protein
VIGSNELAEHEHREPVPRSGWRLVAGDAGDRRLPSEQDSASDRQATLGTWLVLLGITAGALLLRLHNLEKWGLWIDELHTVQHSVELAFGMIDTRSLAYLPSLIGFELAGIDMASLDPREIWIWRSAGVTEWSMRAPVAFLGAITIPVLGLLSCRALGTRTALWLSLLLALSPWHLWMSQVGRFYMQLFLLYNIALLLYYEATEQGSTWRAAVSMLCVVLAFYTTPIALAIALVVGIDLAASLLRRRPTGLRPAFWVIGAVGVAVCLLGVGVQLGEEYEQFSGNEQSIPMVVMGMVYLVGVPIAVVAALGFWAMIQRNERLAILLAAAALVPLAAFVAFNLLGKDTHVRYTFVALFAWLALAAAGIELIVAALRPRWGMAVACLPAMALLSTFALSDYIYMTGGAGYQAPWGQALAYVEAHRRPGEPVLGDKGVVWIAEYYLEDSDVVLLAEDFSAERDLAALVSGPAWIVQHVGFRGADRFQESWTRGAGLDTAGRRRQASALGELRAYFTNRIAQPYRAVNVYYYDPLHAPTPAAGRRVHDTEG